MSTEWIAFIVVGVLILLMAYLAMRRSTQTKHLRDMFGDEYIREREKSGRAGAERELSEREKRVERLHLKELPAEKRLSYAESWQSVQAQFVNDPQDAVERAQSLVEDVMNERGYPVVSFDQMAADISVEHPGVVQNYRAAHRIAVSNTRGIATTEDLRQAMVHYRALFSELLGATPVS
jgi:hypothetical protein